MVSIEPDGFEEAQCIKVAAEDQLYVTRNYIVTHNTIQALTVAALDFDAGIASRVLVVCDAGLKYNWAYDEISDLTEFTWMVLDGDPLQRAEQLAEFEQTHCDILIVNYEQVVAHWRELNDIGFDIVMVDECQEIKNQKAGKTKAVHQLRPKRWILMSGTPLENRPDELWSPLRLVDPNTPKYWPWVQRHCLFGGFGGRQIVGVKKRSELKAYLEDVMIRRIKADTLKLPEKEFTKIEVELSPLQRELYDEVIDELQLTMPSDPTPMELESGLTRTLRLRQICSTPANLGFEDDSAKLDAVIEEYLKLAAQGHKCVFFSQFRETIACLERRIQAHDLPVWTIRGGVKQKERKLRERGLESDCRAGCVRRHLPHCGPRSDPGGRSPLLHGRQALRPREDVTGRGQTPPYWPVDD